MRYLPRSNSLFTDVFNDFFPNVRNDVMKSDIHENNGLYTLDVELPGFKKEDISLDVDDGYLIIKAKNEVSEEEKNEKGEIIRSERSFGSCSRSFYVGANIKASDVKARFENGILAVTLPSEKQKQIESKEQISID